ncbi:NNMT/PNMT/TEMT family protein [Ancylostoma caninum]|uniref:NNMT/PNMT/TEMT family protein n=1 Tax=Ancylostoma caninum TaxID=29170 RepID=A0A368H2F1_ANCCA|nr:NNMT/PNMT/TEMT family protein [Ancylostoma caninum]
MSLFALPVFAHTIQKTLPPEDRQTLLDIGAGPTVYSALCFRDVVKRVYLSDYLSKNLDILKAWRSNTSIYDWKPTIKVILRTEGALPASDPEMEEVEERARAALKCGGILYANVHEDPVVPDMKGEQVSKAQVQVMEEQSNLAKLAVEPRNL